MAKRTCDKCGDDWPEPPNIYYATVCMKKELENGRREIKALKQSLKEWKDAWFGTRSIIGWLWWRHPAIASDAQRAYYQAEQADRK